MEPRNLAMAVVISARSRSMVAIASSASPASISARRLTGPISSRSRVRRSKRRLAFSSESGERSAGSSGKVGFTPSRSRMRSATVPQAWLAAVMLPSSRARASRALLMSLSALRAARAAASVSACALFRVSAARRCAASAAARLSLASCRARAASLGAASRAAMALCASSCRAARSERRSPAVMAAFVPVAHFPAQRFQPAGARGLGAAQRFRASSAPRIRLGGRRSKQRGPGPPWRAPPVRRAVARHWPARRRGRLRPPWPRLSSWLRWACAWAWRAARRSASAVRRIASLRARSKRCSPARRASRAAVSPARASRSACSACWRAARTSSARCRAPLRSRSSTVRRLRCASRTAASDLAPARTV